MPPPIPTPIYHITAIENLPSILADGGLGSCTWLAGRGGSYTSIAHQTIQAQRMTTPVPCGPVGTVHDYVPFYFAPRSPMLFAIHNGKVEQYTQGQEPVVYLVA